MVWIPISELLIHYKLDCESRNIEHSLTGWIKCWRKAVRSGLTIIYKKPKNKLTKYTVKSILTFEDLELLQSIVHAFNKIPLKEDVGSKGESSYELVSKLELLLKNSLRYQLLWNQKY